MSLEAFRSEVSEKNGALSVRAAWRCVCGHRTIAWWPAPSQRGARALAETLRRLAKRNDITKLSDLTQLVTWPASLTVVSGCPECGAAARASRAGP